MEEVKYEYTKTPLSYQITEYDCGQTTLLNALRYMFKRCEILPNVIKTIMQYTLDLNDNEGEIGKGGTSIYAMEYLSNWINEISTHSEMKMVTQILKGEEANIDNEKIKYCIDKGGCAILRVWQSEEHYVLCTKIEQEYVYLFDPYYLNINYYDTDEECEIIKDRPFEFNRKVSKERLSKLNKEDFSLVDGKNREILLINR